MTKRTRVFQNDFSREVNTFRFHTASTGKDTYTPVPTSVNSVSDFMDDVVTPNFRAAIASGFIINNPAFHLRRTITNSGGSYYATENATGNSNEYLGEGGLSHSMIASIHPTFSDFQYSPTMRLNMELAKQQALAKIDSTPYAFLEDILEFRKTAEYLTNPMTTFRSLSRDFNRRRSQLERVGTYAEALGKAWLEYRFALMPVAISISNIINEMLDTIDESKRSKESRKTRRTSRARIDDKVEQNEEVVKNLSGSGYTNKFYFSHDLSSHFTTRAGILYDTTNPVDTFMERNGLRFKDVPRAAWNIVPYSWLVDRFINIGNFISGVINLADPQLKILAAWNVYDVESIDTKRFLRQEITGWSVSANGDPTTFSDIYYAREVWYPTWLDAIPPIGFKADWKTLADVTALILANFRA